MLRYIAPGILFAVMLPVFLIGLNRDPSALPSPYLDKAAPSFSLPALADPAATVSNEDYRGQLVLVNVWATWCVGCRQEHAYLMQLRARGEIPIYGLNWRDERDSALEWIAKLGDPYVASAYDADGRAGIDWGVYGAPETFLLDAKGIVLYKHLGPLDEQVWQREFVPRISASRNGTS